MPGSNIKPAPAISPVMADAIIGWLNDNREGPAPVAPHEVVQVYTLEGLTAVFVGDRDCALFEGRNG